MSHASCARTISSGTELSATPIVGSGSGVWQGSMTVHTDLSDARWFKSSHSQAGGECVEVAHLSDTVGVRDSKNPSGPVLRFSPAEWDAFIRAASADS
ncbi:DUF397 domain-containing protein [Nocardia sp. NPDC019395]|uniref:DUF397 domain-containing protein n=1 Tax=Nocardia sp. NPDC019395 TaxID=3154686 RepID=UPI0033CF44AA